MTVSLVTVEHQSGLFDPNKSSRAIQLPEQIHFLGDFRSVPLYYPDNVTVGVEFVGAQFIQDFNGRGGNDFTKLPCVRLEGQTIIAMSIAALPVFAAEIAVKNDVQGHILLIQQLIQDVGDGNSAHLCDSP